MLTDPEQAACMILICAAYLVATVHRVGTLKMVRACSYVLLRM